MNIETDYSNLENAVDSFLRIYEVRSKLRRPGIVTVDLYDLHRLADVLEKHKNESANTTH